MNNSIHQREAKICIIASAPSIDLKQSTGRQIDQNVSLLVFSSGIAVTPGTGNGQSSIQIP
jgi:hypothetical protein